LKKIDSTRQHAVPRNDLIFSPDSLSGVLNQSRRITPATTLKVAYSGGLDSTVLLHALARLSPAAGWSLEAIHVHHGLHPQAERWLDECRRFCDSLSVPFRQERVNIDDHADHGLEAAARQARYAALARSIGAGDVLLTAHHQDDQAETLLLQLLRGAGVAGLAAMPTEAPFSGGWHVRPLLSFRRDSLRAYALSEGLQWIDDSSNLDTRRNRNFLRHRVLSLIESHWPSAAAALARAAGHAAEASGLVAALAAGDLDRGRRADGSLALSALALLPVARQRNVLRQWIRASGRSAPPAHTIDTLLGLIAAKPGTGHAELSIGDYLVYLYQDGFYLRDAPLDVPSRALDWDPDETLNLPDGRQLRLTATFGAGLSQAGIAGRRLTVDWRQGGESCRLAGQPHQQTLKKILQSSAIPPWQRPCMPLLRVDGELAAIGDRWICEPFAARAHEPGFLVRIGPDPGH
jgi:tRNA(Ile)-lysidine synthase